MLSKYMNNTASGSLVTIPNIYLRFTLVNARVVVIVIVNVIVKKGKEKHLPQVHLGRYAREGVVLDR